MEQQMLDLFRQQNPNAKLDPGPNVLIVGAYSPATAVVVGDYPYGRRLRCFMRYWLEHKPKNGTRLVTQTNNPKKPGLQWNKPHADTYSNGITILKTNADGHVKQAGISSYNLQCSTTADAEKMLETLATFESVNADAFTEADKAFMQLANEIVSKRLIELGTPHPKAEDNSICGVCKNYVTNCTGQEKAEAPPVSGTPTLALVAVLVLMIVGFASVTSAQQRPIIPCGSDSDCARKNGGSGGPESSPPDTRVPFYCEAPTKSGKPCRRRVKAKGLHCYQHRTQAGVAVARVSSQGLRPASRTEQKDVTGSRL